MLQKIITLAAISALSGCTLMDGEKYSRATIDAINQSENKLQTRLDTVNNEIARQHGQIQELSTELARLNAALVTLSNNQTLLLEERRAEKAVLTVQQDPQGETRAAFPSQTLVLGSVEKVKIDTIKTQIDARVDTGAETSSLNAMDIQEFERNGKTWVRFHINDSTVRAEDKQWIEAPIIRYARIRQSSTEKTERRSVIKLFIQLGKIRQQTEFTLADRSEMSHPMLLGREFIQDIALVDVSKTYLQSNQQQVN